MSYDGREYVSEVVSPEGQHYGWWIVQVPGFQVRMFNNPEEALAYHDESLLLYAVAKDRVSEDGD